MSWNYRVIRNETKSEFTEFYVGIHEVYYRDNKPISYSENPINIFALEDENNNGIDEIKNIMKKIERALSEPVLTTSDFVKS